MSEFYSGGWGWGILVPEGVLQWSFVTDVDVVSFNDEENSGSGSGGASWSSIRRMGSCETRDEGIDCCALGKGRLCYNVRVILVDTCSVEVSARPSYERRPGEAS